MFKLAMVVRRGKPRLGRAIRGLHARLSAAWRRPRRSTGPLLGDERGSALIEFAFVAPPFLLLLVGILEVSVMFFTSTVIEGATKEAARQIRTGQIQESADPLVAFRDQLCDSLLGVIDCTKVKFDVQTFSSFSDVSMSLEIDEDGEIENTIFSPGGSSAVTVVRAIYRWEFMTPLIDKVMPASVGGHLLISTVAFQNEPYNVN